MLRHATSCKIGKKRATGSIDYLDAPWDELAVMMCLSRYEVSITGVHIVRIQIVFGLTTSNKPDRSIT